MTKRRLKILSDLRRFIADIMNQYHSDQIDGTKASKIAYIANVMKGIIHTERDNDILERLEAIEFALEGKI